MVQCPDCEEKDKIVIAGKVFCANCGAPWQPGKPKSSGAVSGSNPPTASVLPTAKKLGPTPKPAAIPVKAAAASAVASPPKPIQPPANSQPKPLRVEKINNIDDRLAAIKKARPASVQLQSPQTAVVKEISTNLAVRPAAIAQSENGVKSTAIKPIVPHSPIGDLESGAMPQPDALDTSTTEPAKNPNLIDQRVLSENSQPAAVAPIPSERIAAVINEVLTNKDRAISANNRVASQPQPASPIELPAQNRPPVNVAPPSASERFQVAASIPKSDAINKFNASPASGIVKPTAPPPPPPKPPASESQPANVETFRDLAKTVPIKQAGPIKVAATPAAAPKETAAPATNSQAKQALDDLTQIINDNQTTPAPQATPAGPSPDVKTDPIAAARAATIASVEQATNEPTEHIGSEIISLDNKDESILSDDEFKQLSETKAAPAVREIKLDSISQVPQNSEQPKVAAPQQQPANQPKSAKPKIIKPLDIAAPTSTKPTSAAEVKTTTPGSSNVANLAGKSDRITVLPPSPDGITPGAAFRPSHAVNYPVMTAPKSVEADDSKPLTEAEALDIIHQRAAEKAKIPQAKVGHSFTASSAVMSIIGLVLVGAYIWQVNYPNLAFKVAASKAGINANAPSYVPSGWKLSNNIKTAPGVVSYNLESSNDKHQVAITQAKTDWDSQALAENYVTPKSANYLALQAQGLTIYMYGDNQASWINHGNWYRLEGQNHGLAQDQIIKIATSL